MSNADLLQNIERLLREQNESADAVSRRAGKPDAIRNLRRYVAGEAKGTWTIDTLDAVAQALKTTPWDLLKPESAVFSMDHIRTIVREEVEQSLRPPQPTRKRG